MIAPRTAADPVLDRLVREASGLAGRVGLRLLDPRRRALHKKHACQIEECANRYIRKGDLFNEIAMPDPLVGKYGGVVIAPTQ